MKLHEHTVAYESPLLPALARWLLEVSPRAAAGDLTGTLVLLPAKRPCDRLKHVLLEECGRAALLLPEITTPAWLADAVAARLGLLAAPVPPEHLRAPLLATLLAQRAAQLSWLVSTPESAPGLARELVSTFDEIRLHGLGPALLEESGAPTLELAGDPPALEIDHRDLSRLRTAWRLYRELIPRDAVDRLLEVLAALRTQKRWSAPPCERLAAAGFVTLDPTTAELIRRLAGARDLHLFQPAAAGPLCRLFLASYGADPGPQHPLAPSREVAVLLAGDGGSAALAAGSAGTAPQSPAPYREQLEQLRPELRSWPDDHTLDLLACGDPEDESRTVAAVVAAELEAWQQRGGLHPPRIGVATADTELARRIAAQLSDAGLDCDDTGGIPLAELPAGRLAQRLLQVALTDLRHGPLLELLTHPFVRLREDAVSHRKWTLHFEKMLRGEQQRMGLESHLERAVVWDQAVANLYHQRDGRMQDFVTALGEALAPLLRRAGGEEAAWVEHLAALRESWSRVAPDRPFDGDKLPPDQMALGRLLEVVERTSRGEGLAGPPPRVGFADFASIIGRLLREGSQSHVRPNRREFLPVQLTGLLEARLEEYDLLILAGTGEEVFPGRLRRPLLLSEGARAALGLPRWPQELGRQADLFLRLLHAGRSLVVTWPAERLGQPCLPSPFVLRIALSGLVLCQRTRPAPLFRRERDMAPTAQIAAAQERFREEPAEIPLSTAARPLRRLSHTALRTYLDCPYRFLLERGFGLREEEEVLEEFRRLDYGSRVHACLQRFLTPRGPAHVALERGEREPALAELERLATEVFEADAEALPQSRLWAAAFRACASGLVDYELRRFAAGWRPWRLEQPFALPLSALRDWLTRQLAGVAAPDSRAGPPELAAEVADLRLVGTIDRIDRRGKGAEAAWAVLTTRPGRRPASPASGTVASCRSSSMPWPPRRVVSRACAEPRCRWSRAPTTACIRRRSVSLRSARRCPAPHRRGVAS
jgi:ATP-dependent helicase/nuclease subunit B